MKKVSFHTLGCRLNQSETAMITQSFLDAGYAVAESGETSNVCVINTCTVTSASDAKCRTSVRRVIREHPGARVAVIGCYAESGFKALGKISGVDLIVGNQEKMNLLHYLPEEKLDSARVVKEKIQKRDFEIHHIGQSSNRTRVQLKIQDGCSFVCSFCIIPRVRGPARSRDMKNLLEEAESLISNGAREIVLTGVNLGTYDNQGASLVDVVDEIAALKIDRLRISSIEPTTVDPRLFERMRDPNHALVPFLHLPLQSGSDHVLSEMRRRYTRQEYLQEIELAVKEVPNIGIGTDIMTGYPSESEEDFAASAELIEKAPIDYAHVFSYSKRSGTLSAKLPSLPVETVKTRTNVLRRLSEDKRRQQGGSFLGQEIDVLFENCQEGMWQGYSENYLHVKVKERADLENQIIKVKVDEVCGDWVLGRLA